MSEEMNLYKRCKNIFKFHGVDMGGGDSQTVVKIMLTENVDAESDDNPYIIESDMTVSEIEEAFESSNVVAWVYSKNYETEEWIKQYQLNCATCVNAGGNTMVVFTAIMNMGMGANILTLFVMGEEWNFSATPIPLS